MESAGEDDESTVQEYVRRERSAGGRPRVPITGLMMQYYVVCERELWFFSRGIDIDRETPNIQRGTHIDETSYEDQRRSFQINGRIALDILDSGEVMEVKASSALEEPARMQLLYYLWYLDTILDVQRDGVLAYPRERKRESVTLDTAAHEKVEDAIRGIIETVERNQPPELEEKPYCDSCLYQDICWV